MLVFWGVFQFSRFFIEWFILKQRFPSRPNGPPTALRSEAARLLSPLPHVTWLVVAEERGTSVSWVFRIRWSWHPKGSFSTGYFARTLASETGVSGCASVNLHLHGIAADLHGLVKRSTDLETCPQAARYAHEVREHVQRMLGEETLPPSPDLLNTCWLVKTIACMLPATHRKQLLFLATKLQLRGFLEASEVSTAVVGEAISAACFWDFAHKGWYDLITRRDR